FQVSTLPRPVQDELPVWVTTAGNPDTYIQAGRIGANVLTHLLGQSVEQLAPKIEAYRKARAEAGFDPDAGIVSLMLHSFVSDDADQVRELVREPLKQYLGTSFSLLKEYAWSFPAFQRPEGDARGSGVDSLADDDFKNLSDEDLDAVLEFAFLRYFESSGLFGTPESCQPMVDRLKGIGVNEIACLIDFGVATDTVLESLPHLEAVLQLSNAGVGAAGSAAAVDGTTTAADSAGALDQSVAAQLRRHQVTHLQCTPSMARMLTMQDDSRAALATVDHLFIGGEAFPVALAKDLLSLSASGSVTNMYGPTETTIWSTTWPLEGDLDIVPIGTPIANTQIYVLDQNLQPLPPGVQGELWIGGLGVVRGYHERPELTAERFVPDPFAGGTARMYRTGDLARWRQREDGSGLLEFLGRIDHQVKIRGYRIELGEIEAQLGKDPGVLECVAVVQEQSAGDQQLVAYVSPKDGATIEPSVVKDRLRQHLPEVMVPGHVVVLDVLPHTPNGKIDRNALPSLAEVRSSRAASAPAAEASSDLERQVLAIWEDTLGTTGIGIDDNFFDIGGHSLLLVRMQRRIRDGLERNVPLTDLYRYPTVRSFAQSLTSDVTATVMQSSQDRAARRREAMSRRRTRA
ncbi:MAG TPA: LLM class flavin-dependent oxidoreductase, partial [Acidimicrobiales bacterium]|nr:LLM class flavin-dependent oxidoreductase [Acidimicrobiales bacterium]